MRMMNGKGVRRGQISGVLTGIHGAAACKSPFRLTLRLATASQIAAHYWPYGNPSSARLMCGFGVTKPPFAAFHFPSVSTALVVGLERSNGMAPPSSSQRSCESLFDSSNTCGLIVTLQGPEMKRQCPHGVPQPVLLLRALIDVRSASLALA